MRIALHTRLRAGTEEAYEQAHREIPAELTAAMRAAGAREWTIWRSGLDLFHVIDCDDYEYLIAQLAPLPVNVKWQQRMGQLLAVSHDYSASAGDAALPIAWQL